MDDMQFSKYSCDIREILSKTDREGLETLVRNAVAACFIRRKDR